MMGLITASILSGWSWACIMLLNRGKGISVIDRITSASLWISARGHFRKAVMIANIFPSIAEIRLDGDKSCKMSVTFEFFFIEVRK